MDVVDRLWASLKGDGSAIDDVLNAAIHEISVVRARVATLERMDREAASHVESVICMRTRFTGKPPYVGWKGLGLALTEELDERDRLRQDLSTAIRAGKRLIDNINEFGDVTDEEILNDAETQINALIASSIRSLKSGDLDHG
jgi:3-deoxy-D-arabino-heptulosonate 7-phosphate (DAHP) synthase